VTPAELEQVGLLVYIQDSPGLNNLDWHVSIEQSMHEVVSRDLGQVIKLPRGDIAQYQPSVLYAPDGTTCHLPNTADVSTHVGSWAHVPPPGGAPQSECGTNGCPDSSGVYVVLARSE
jgi:hypothetical protein